MPKCTNLAVIFLGVFSSFAASANPIDLRSAMLGGGNGGAANIQAIKEQIRLLQSAAVSTIPSASKPSAPREDYVNAQDSGSVRGGQGSGVEVLKKIQGNDQASLLQGAVIPAVLNMGINSDLPSQLTAVVNIDIYDSIGGMTLLIPKGSKLIASVGNDVKIGQERLMVSFNRLLFPDGSYVMLNKMQGADLVGNGGVDANVDNHFFKQFGAGLIMAVLSYGIEKSSTGGVTVQVTNSSANLTTDVGNLLKDITNRMLDRYQGMKPTLKVAPGTKINLIVSTDILLEPYSH